MRRSECGTDVHNHRMQETTTMSKKKSTAEKQTAIEKRVAEPKPTPEKEQARGKTRAAVWEEVGEGTSADEPKPAASKPAESKAARKSTEKAPAKAKRAADEIMPKARAAEELVVFAFRLTEAERDAIHAAAGPARASRFVRAVAIAAARRDVAQLQSILLETQRGTTS